MKTPTKAIAAIMIMSAVMLTAGCTEEENNFGTDTTINLGTGDRVDLGLPSGLLWATRNVGALSLSTDFPDATKDCLFNSGDVRVDGDWYYECGRVNGLSVRDVR